MKELLVLFGAGAAGGYALKFLRDKGIEPSAFADNDPWKWQGEIEDVTILDPKGCLNHYPDATWVACAISRPAATEIRKEIAAMGVKTMPLWECIPVFHGLPPEDIRDTLFPCLGDVESCLAFNDQIIFRTKPDYYAQDDPSPKEETYFPDFIKKLHDEVFVDCGAADGDSIQAFMERWADFKGIIAFEPDRENYKKMICQRDPKGKGRITQLRMAVGGFDGDMSFAANGDYSSHLGAGDEKVRVVTLDKMLGDNVPTYIKMDIEGAEPEALWGARKLIKEHSPVLAICAYHTSDHLWEIPLLIHAINPGYKLFFRRYAEGAFEIVWYAVPPDRIK
jgi:FkbM family methyltransferase